MSGGLEVQVPANAASGSGTLAGSQIRPPAPAPQGMSLAGPAYRLDVTGARLTSQVRLTLPVPPAAATGTSGPDAALLAYYDPTSRAWVPVPASYDPARRTLTALTPHLSVWTALRVDAGKLLAGATNLLKGFLDVSGTTGQPSCPGYADLAAAGVSAASDKGDLVKWCAGLAGGQPLLRVADNRHYAMEADYPSSWQAGHVGEADPLTEVISTDVAQALSPPWNRLVVDGVRVLIDSVVYWRSYRIAIGSSGVTSCSAQALANAAHAYMVAQGQGSGMRDINAHACDQGYAEILFTDSPGGGPSYQAAMAFKAVSGSWQWIGGGDYIPPGSFGMPVSVGQSLVKALQANAGGDEHLTF